MPYVTHNNKQQQQKDKKDSVPLCDSDEKDTEVSRLQQINTPWFQPKHAALGRNTEISLVQKSCVIFSCLAEILGVNLIRQRGRAALSLLQHWQYLTHSSIKVSPALRLTISWTSGFPWGFEPSGFH